MQIYLRMYYISIQNTIKPPTNQNIKYIKFFIFITPEKAAKKPVTKQNKPFTLTRANLETIITIFNNLPNDNFTHFCQPFGYINGRRTNSKTKKRCNSKRDRTAIIYE